MPYAIPDNHPAAIPVGILLVYVTLFIVRLFSKYATLFRPEGSQQTDLAIQEDTSSTEGTPKRSESLNELFQPNSGSPGKTSVSRGDSATVDITRSTENNDNHITGTADNSSTEDQNSKGHFCVQLSKDHDGTATGPSNRGYISLPGGNLEPDRLYESGMGGKNPERSQPSADRRLGHVAPCQPDQSYCPNLQHEEKARTT